MLTARSSPRRKHDHVNILLLAIRAYQRFWLVNTAVRLAVRLHHLILRPETRPCPYAAEGCSEHFAAQAKLHGLAVLPAILSAMAACGPGVLDKKDCGLAGHAGCGKQWEGITNDGNAGC